MVVLETTIDLVRKAEVHPGIPQELERSIGTILKEYDGILAKYFRDARGPTTYSMDFYNHFKNYEFRYEHKMLPETLRQGSISCSSASLLVGRWWEKLHPGVQPWYVLDASEPDLRKQHVVVYLSKAERSHGEVSAQLFDYVANGHSELLQPDQLCDLLVDYLKRDGMRWMPRTGHYLSQGFSLIHGSESFLANRLALFNQNGV